MSKHSVRNDRPRMKQNEQRSRRFIDAASAWKAAWPHVAQEIHILPVEKAHDIVVARARGILPERVVESLSMYSPGLDKLSASASPERRILMSPEKITIDSR